MANLSWENAQSKTAMRINKINWKNIFLMLLLAFIANMSVVFAGETKTGLLIVAYNGSSWFPYINDDAQSKQWRRVDEIENPAVITRQANSNYFFFKGDDLKLYRYDDKKKEKQTIDLKDDKPTSSKTYTQLRAYQNGLALIELMQGKSRNTRVVNLD